MNARSVKLGALSVALLLLAACGGGETADDREEAGSQPAETVFDPLTTAPGRVEQRLDASREGHEQALDDQINASEGVSTGSAAAP